MRRIIYLVLLISGIVSTAAWATKVNPNPFKIISIDVDGPKAEPGKPLHLILKWELASEYHAYVEQFQLKSLNPKGATTQLQDIRKVKEFYDKTSKQNRQGVEGSGEIFAQVDLPNMLPKGAFDGELELTYQACASDHCLLPKTVKATYRIEMASTHSVEMFGWSVSIHDWRIWVAVFIAGLLTSLTPCVFPLIPITLAVLGARKEHVRRRDGFFLSLSYVLGIAFTYAILGVIAALTGALFGSFLGHPLVVAALAILFISMGLSMLGWFTIETPSFLTNRIFARKNHGGRLGAFIAGTAAGIVASPCVGPVLAALLTYVAQTQNVMQGFALLFVFALGLGQLFLLLGTFSSLQRLIPRSGPWMELVKSIFALSFFGLAIFYLQPFLSSDHQWRVGAALVLITLIHPEAFAHWLRHSRLQRFRTVSKGLIALACGVVLVVGTPSLRWRSLEDIQGKIIDHEASEAWQSFSEEKLAAAKAAGQPVILDFYADWCVACKELETKTFSAAAVVNRTQGFVLLRYDATQTTPEFEALQKRYEIIGLPFVAFFDEKGVWRKDLTLTGFEDAGSFLKRLERLKKP